MNDLTPDPARTFTHADHRRRQERLLQRLLALLADDPRVLGAAAGGSYARGATDAFSDLDLSCFLRDEDRTGRDDVHRRVSALAPALSTLYLYDRNGLYLYEDGVRLDLDYLEPSAIATKNPGATRIVLDPDGALARQLGAAYEPSRAAHPRWWEPGDPTYVAWFLWMFRQIYAWSKRGAQGGESALAKLFNAADSLHQTRASLTAMRLWTLGHPWNLAAVDPEMAHALTRTYPRPLPDELCAATRSLLAVYERVCPDYCAKAGTPYPAEKVAALRLMLDELDLLP